MDERIFFRRSNLFSDNGRAKLDLAHVKNVVRLDEFRRSMSPGVSASRPKYQITTPAGEAYFKFKMSVNEIGAELFTFQIGKALGLEMAETYLASYKDEVGIVSLDIGEYEEPDDIESYSVKDFLDLDGFVEMCLLDYLVMNEDRHAGNWGIRDGKVAPLFDHNNCFGGSDGFRDFDHFMAAVTSYLYVHTEYEQRHDYILQFLVEELPEQVMRFMAKVDALPPIVDEGFEEVYPEHHAELNRLLQHRIEYMKRKVREFGGR